MANALKLTGVKEAMVVCGAEKLDEVSYLYMKWYATILGILIFYVTNRSVLLARLM
jgi:hypothetical protein